MAQATQYMETHSHDPYFNLAFEEYVLTHRTSGNYLLLWQNDNTVVIGQNQNAEEEINRAFVERHQIRVARRTTGGGAVYHDLGNLNYSFITDIEDAQKLTMQRFTAPIVAALRELGVAAETSGRNDIVVNGCKVSGTAQRVYQHRILHHGTLLFDANPDMIAGALHADPEKFRSKSAKSVRSRVGNIRSFLPTDMSLEAFWDYLKQSLSHDAFVCETLSPDELAQVERLRADKYAAWEWNFGHYPQYSIKNKRRWDGGSLEFCANVTHGVISDISFFGDFLSRRPLDGLTAALVGCPYRKKDVASLLDKFPLSELFGAIQKEELLDTIF